jgi:AcrR family transcriptional regulator
MVVNVSALTTPSTVPAPQRLVAAAVAAFAERGYQATTTRDIASRAGMSPAALYVHYPSKEQLLYEISRDGHLGALEVLKAVGGDGTPATRLGEMVAAFTTWHAEHRGIARVVQYELAALSPDHLAEIAAIRREITGTIESALADGVADGSFAVPDLSGTALAVLSMAIDVARWFDPARSQSPDALGALYADLALRMVRSPASRT